MGLHGPPDRAKSARVAWVACARNAARARAVPARRRLIRPGSDRRSRRGIAAESPTASRALGRQPAIASAEVTDHRHPDLGARLRLRDHEGGTDELRHFTRAPLDDALLVRLRFRNATELGEQAMTGIGSEQPVERSSRLRVRLAIQLYRCDRELSVNEILGSSSRSDSSRIREASSLPERLVREDARATACSFGIRL